ncbi:hypothetical protein [Actinophytocola sp.]|jgi:hypothetical protein|uniref:hypothetical protein n=1 Tax=Actinophytocola sp. TaxID=1872138 RepID=UPI002F922F71
MHKRIAGMLAVGITALSAVVAAATPAAAAPPWTISPGGPTNGTAGVTNLVVHDPVNGDITLTCDTSTVAVDLESGTSADNQLATIPETPGIQFNGCLLAGFIQFEVTQVGTWTLNGATFDSGVTNGSIDNITADIAGPGCDATVSGSVGAQYSNSAATLSVVPEPTLTVTRVDELNNCSDLIHENATAQFDGSYTVSPAQTITG